LSDGLGTLAQDLFLSRMPDAPDASTALIESLGPTPEQVFGASVAAVSVVRVRAMCRGARNDYLAARQKATQVRSSLGAIRNETILGQTVLCVMATGDVYPIGRDGDDRPVIGVDFTIWLP